MALKKFRLRRDTSAGWSAYNPVLLEGEPGWDTTLGQLKIGDGATTWADLPVTATVSVSGDGDGGTISVDWGDIANKPALFPPDEHTHVAADVTDLPEVTQDAVAAMIVAGANMTITYDDTAGTLTLASAGGGGGGGLDAEAVRDTIGAALQASGSVTVTVNDTGDTITIGSAATVNSSDATLLARANHTGTQAAVTISDLPETVQDLVGSLVVAGTNMTVTYDDTAGTLTIATTATVNDTDANLKARANHTGTQLAATISDFSEATDDRVAALLAAGTNVTLSYNDAANTLTINATLDTESVQDIIGALLSAGTGAAVVYNDAAGTLVISAGPRTLSNKTTSYTFALADAQTVVEGSSAGALTFTMPNNSAVAFPVGTEIEIHQIGAGAITFAPGSSVSLHSRGNALKTNGQYAVASLRQRVIDEWIVTGDLTT